MKLMVIIFVFIALTKANSMTADFQFCSLECSNNGNIGDVNPTSQHASSRRLNLIQGKSGPKGMKGERGHRGMKGENGEDCDLNTIAYLKKQLGNLKDGLRNSETETIELKTIVGNLTDALRNSHSETNELRSTVEALTGHLRSSEQETIELRSTIAVMTGHLRTSERETNDLRSTVGTLTETLRPQNCSQIKEHYPESETGIHTIYKNNLKANGRQVACDMSDEGVELPTSCSDILQSDHSATNGIYKIFVEPSTIADVYCDMSDQGVQVYESCSDILQSDPSATNGIYKVVYESPSTITNIYCDMSNQGIGIARNCSETLHFSPSSTNGIYKIFVEPSTIADVYCDMSDKGIEIPTSCSIQLQLDPLSTNGIYKIFVEPSTITNIYCDMSDQGIERYKTCDEVLQLTPSSTNGIYRIFPNPSSSESTDVYCNMVEGGWTVFQRRFDGSTDFRKNFEGYTNGFGNKNAEYWLGLENLYQITKTGRYELYIKLLAYNQEEAFAKYSDFSIGSGPGYRLHYGTYSGTAGDSLTNHNGMMFTTYDRDQDEYSGQCSDIRGGAWWFYSCANSNLNAHLYGNRGHGHKSMYWYHLKGSYTPMKETTMMLRKLN